MVKYLILSIKWSPSRSGYAVWWRAKNNGYTEDINQAGRYTQEQIDAQPDYYNDSRHTFAVLEDEVLEKSKEVRLGELSQFWKPKKGETQMAQCEVETCENEQRHLNGCETCGLMVCDECHFDLEDPATCINCD